MEVRGVSYTVGDAPVEAMRRDLRAIRDDLHCTTVMLIGTDSDRQAEAAEQALDVGLDVYIRPYLPDRRRTTLLSHLAATASAAERLRAAHPGRVTLLVGREFSLTSPECCPARGSSCVFRC